MEKVGAHLRHTKIAPADPSAFYTAESGLRRTRNSREPERNNRRQDRALAIHYAPLGPSGGASTHSRQRICIQFAPDHLTLWPTSLKLQKLHSSSQYFNDGDAEL